MAYPTKPSLSTSYTAVEQSLGDGSFPGQELDVDLVALKAAIEGVIDFIQGVTRSDGKLANQSVSRETLAEDILLGFDAPSAWESGRSYIVPNTVFFDSVFYVCAVDHTAGADFATDLASGRWVALVDFGAETTEAQAAAADAAVSATNAATSATNAAASAAAAAASEGEAAGSANLAADWAEKADGADVNGVGTRSARHHANASAASATAASTSASAAASSASAASTSATNASNSASAASASATNASNSASAASTSATNAANSATAASGSASNAASSASAAAGSATSAATSATNASGSASAAAASETNAAGSASAASTSETNAAASATAAATSESNAAGSATAAAGSATSAANSAAAAAASLDNFDDRYLGPKDADPTLDNDGNALLTGALYYNNVAREMRVYDGANWIAASSAGNVSLLKYEYTATAGQTVFSGADDNAATLSYTAANVIVSLNGVILDDGADYTATDGTSVTLASGTAAGDLLAVIAFKSFTVADMVPASTGGTFNGNVAVNGTLTATDFAGDGSALTGVGKVLQVVSTTKTDVTSFTSVNTNAYVDIAGMSVTITPTSATSKIFVMYTANVSNSTTATVHVRLLRNSTSIGQGVAEGNRLGDSTIFRPADTPYVLDIGLLSNFFLDSPNTTAPTTYKLAATLGATYNGTFYLNRPAGNNDTDWAGRTASTITVMEIAG